jgi:hypothetical protein
MWSEICFERLDECLISFRIVKRFPLDVDGREATLGDTLSQHMTEEFRGRIPRMPVWPPKNERFWLANAYTTIPSARVIIRK